jgi:hypothetical protein
MKLDFQMNYDRLIPNLGGKILNHVAILKKTSDNFLCIYEYLKKLRFVNVGSTIRQQPCIVIS